MKWPLVLFQALQYLFLSAFFPLRSLRLFWRSLWTGALGTPAIHLFSPEKDCWSFLSERQQSTLYGRSVTRHAASCWVFWVWFVLFFFFLEEESLQDSLESLLLEVQVQTSKFPLAIDGLNYRLAQAQDSSGSKIIEKSLWKKRFPFYLTSSLTKVRQKMEYDSVFPSATLHTSWKKRQRHKMENAFLELRQVGHK